MIQYSTANTASFILNCPISTPQLTRDEVYVVFQEFKVCPMLYLQFSYCIQSKCPRIDVI